MNGHISKPIDTRVLQNTIGQLLYAASESSRQEAEIPPVTVTAAANDTPESPWLDETAALKNLDGDRELYVEMIQMFLQENTGEMDKIRLLLAEGDHNGAHRVAHTLKGLAGTLGLPRLQQAALAVDQAFKNMQYEQLSTLLPRLEQEFGKAIQGLKDVYDLA
jgi:HPt (histidine-containing phosphotransfer) domain-containing protein